MRTSDDRRREVAQALRGLNVSDIEADGLILDGPTYFGLLLMRILDEANDYRPGLHYFPSHFSARAVVDLFADLIDPRTPSGARHGNDGGRSDGAPDSWERLEGDVRRSLGPMAACSYFGRGMGDGCRGCPSGARGRDCNRAMAGDILRRSEALAGVARQTCRLVPCGDGTGKGACGECHGALTDRDNFCPDCGREIEVTDD